MSSLDDSARRDVRRIALRADAAWLRDDEVFIRSHLGRLEALRRPASLPRRLRTLLMLVDGRASVADLRRGLSNYRSLDEGLDMLRAMGLIETLPPALDP